MSAVAFTSGNHVAFGRTPDLRTAAHEAAHVIQQRAGVNLSGGFGTHGDPYERHADTVADAVVHGRSAEALLAVSDNAAHGNGHQQPAIQLLSPTNKEKLKKHMEDQKMELRPRLMSEDIWVAKLDKLSDDTSDRQFASAIGAADWWMHQWVDLVQFIPGELRSQQREALSAGICEQKAAAMTTK